MGDGSSSCSFESHRANLSVSDLDRRRKGIQLANSRCAVASVHDVVSSFNQSKRDIVKSMGFDGLLDFPPLKKLNRKFSLWIMSKVDESARSIVLDNGRSIPFNRDDVGKVFGIPCTGRRIIEKRGNRKGCRIGTSGEISGTHFKELRSIKEVQQLLEREYHTGMTEVEADHFKAAFVVFVMSALFAPGSKHDYIFADYWNALSDPGDIQSYDWASYVIDRLIDAVVKLKSDITRKSKVTSITGCPLFLQVIYLDSIDLGLWNLEHNIFPRIKSFTPDRIRMMIEVDSRQASDNGDAEYGISDIRQADGICYSWANEVSEILHMPEAGEHGDLWESIVLMARRLKIPIEAAGPVYLAISEHKRQLNDMYHREGTKIIRAVTAILEPFMKGFNYQLDIDCSMWDLDHYSSTQHCHAGTHFNDSMKLGEYNFHTNERKRKALAEIIGNKIASELGAQNDHSKDADILADTIVMKAMSQFYLVARKSKSPRSLDLNQSVYDLDQSNLCARRMRNRSLLDTKSPWELGFQLGFNREDLRQQMRHLLEIQDSSNGDTPWFMHYIPKSIEVAPGAVKIQFLGISEMDMDMFDVLIRRIKQLDDSLYAGHGPFRWRHFVESDLLAALIAGDSYHFEAAFREQLGGKHISYDVNNSKIIFFPFILEHRWVCYAWLMDENSVVIFDPAVAGGMVVETTRLHEEVIAMMKRGMFNACLSYFPLWSHDWHGASMRFHHFKLHGDTRNRTGILAAYFCCNFDGHHVSPDFDQITVDEIAALMLTEAVKLDGNIGKIPGHLL